MKYYLSAIFFLFFFSAVCGQQNSLSLAINDTTIYHNPKPIKWGYTATFQIDVIDANFGQFASGIGNYNTKALDGFVGVFNLELAATKNRKYFGVTFGLLFSNNLGNHDSLNIDINKNLYAINFGYKIINNRKVSLMPALAIKWYRYRLLNADKETKIPLNQYLNDRELDLRFNQTTAFFGAHLSFKFPYKVKENNFRPRGFWTLGVYGGYLIKLHQRPIIFSKRNQLSTNHEIDLKNYNFGIFYSMNISS